MRPHLHQLLCKKTIILKLDFSLPLVLTQSLRTSTTTSYAATPAPVTSTQTQTQIVYAKPRKSLIGQRRMLTHLQNHHCVCGNSISSHCVSTKFRGHASGLASRSYMLTHSLRTSTTTSYAATPVPVTQTQTQTQTQVMYEISSSMVRLSTRLIHLKNHHRVCSNTITSYHDSNHVSA
jgi:hypothetical protein